MHLAFVWQKEWNFFSPCWVSFWQDCKLVLYKHYWAVVWAPEELLSTVSKLSLPEFFKRPCAEQHLILLALGAAVQDRTGAFWAYEVQHSSLNPYFPHFFTFQKTPKSWHSSTRNISCTLHALFTRNSLMQRASASHFSHTASQSAQFLTKWIHVLGGFYLNYPVYICAFLKCPRGVFSALTELQRCRTEMHIAAVKNYLLFGQV